MKARHFLFFIAIVVIGVLFARNIDNFANLQNLIQNMNIWILSTILIVRYLSYWANTKYFQSFFKIFNHDVEHKRLFPVVMGMNFVNTVFPSGGISGVSYMSRELEDKLDSHTVTIAQIFWYPISFFCFLFFAGLAFLLLFLSDQVAAISFKIVLIFLIVVIIIGVMAAVLLFSRDLTKKLLVWSTRPINAIMTRFKRSTLSIKNVEKFVDEFYGALDYISKNHLRLKGPIMSILAYFIFEIFSIYVIFLAFGTAVNPGLVIAGYILALVFSLASIFTGGIGVYEATMVATFVALGQPFALSLSVVTVYRLIALWLYVPLGLYYYKRTMIDKNNQPAKKRYDGK